MLHMVDQATAVVAASAAVADSGAGRATVPIVLLVMAGAGIGIIALIGARRLWSVELLFTGVFFTLLGASPVGRALWDWLWSI